MKQSAIQEARNHRRDNPHLYCPVRSCRWKISAGPCPKLGHAKASNNTECHCGAFTLLANLVEESREITIARRRDGNVWITDGENTLSGITLWDALTSNHRTEEVTK